MALAGFLSSVCATKVITKSLLPINVEDQINRFWDSACNLWKENSAKNSTPEQPIYQSSRDKELYEFRYQELLHTSTDKEEKARVLAVSSQGASDWLHAFPIISLSTMTFKVSCRQLLGTYVHDH